MATRGALRAAHAEALLGRTAANLALDRVELADAQQRLRRNRGAGLGVHLEEPPPQVCPAEGERDRVVAALALHRLEPVVAVHLQGAPETLEVSRGARALAVRRVGVGDRGRRPALPGAVVHRVGPERSLAGAAQATFEGGQWRVVGEHPGLAADVGEDALVEGPEPPAGRLTQSQRVERSRVTPLRRTIPA